MPEYVFYMPTIEGTVGGLIPDDISLPTLISGDVLDLATKTITFSNKSTRKLTDEQVKSYHKYRKVIELAKVGDVADTLEILEDGSGVLTRNSREVVFNGSENISLFSQPTDTNYKAFSILISDMKDYSKVLCNYFVNGSGVGTATTEFVASSNFSRLVVVIKTEKASDIESFKKYLASNTVTVCYQLSTPTITHIDKYLMPAILTQATNEFKFGDAVMATKAAISVPVNRIAEMQKEIDEIKALIQAPSNINLTMNYIEDEYNKNQEVEGVM